MSLYPTLEDLQVGSMMQAQLAPGPGAAPVAAPTYPQMPQGGHVSYPSNQQTTYMQYPALLDMGLELSPEDMRLISGHSPSAPSMRSSVSVTTTNPMAVSTQYHHQVMTAPNNMVAPVTGGDRGMVRANVTHGVREVTLCKGADGKIGLKMQHINKGVFVVLVKAASPAAIVGLRFGDQILQIDGENVAGYSQDKVHKILKSCPINGIKIIVRDRPFERTVTLVRDSVGHLGFGVKNGKVDSIVRDSSAARNGLLTEHHILEIQGASVVGMKDTEIQKIMKETPGHSITITIMPSFIYDHLVKNVGFKLFSVADHD